MVSDKTLRERCHVNTNSTGDRFVGVRVDAHGAAVCFPLGYQLPANDDDLRADICNLFHVLAAFLKEDALLEAAGSPVPGAVRFPMHAYLKIIRDFLRTGRYYVETEPQYKTAAGGRTSWPRTVRQQRALIQRDGSLIFPRMTVRSSAPNADHKITQIHRFCVYEAFEKMGWLYVPYMPEAPGPHPDTREAIYLLEKKLAWTHNDAQQELLSAMLSMLQYTDEASSETQHFFGTDLFEHVWEKMIDKAFGTPDKERFFPRTRWLLDYGPNKAKTPLQPDSIMLYNGKVYVLDAKFYRYGCTGDSAHLPGGPDINKQITYGEYIERAKGVPGERLYNAFLMPFNCAENPFAHTGPDGTLCPGIPGVIGNIGEAVGDWKPDPKNYERVQGIVIDTRFLMYHYLGMPDQQKRQLAEAIETVETRPFARKNVP